MQGKDHERVHKVLGIKLHIKLQKQDLCIPYQVRRQNKVTNEEVEIQKEVITPFFINRDFLGCDSGTSAKYRSEWGSYIVDILLELGYIQSGEELGHPQDFIPSLWHDSSQLLTFYIKTDWYSGRSAFSVDRDGHEETSPTSEHLFTPASGGRWRAPGESDEYSNTIFMVVAPEMGEFYQDQVSTLREDGNEDIVPYLPRHRFDTLIKFLLRWVLESFRDEYQGNLSEISVLNTGDSLYSHWLSSILSVGWTREEFQEVGHLLIRSTELKEDEKIQLLSWFQFSKHSGTSYQVIPETQQTSTQRFSFTEERNESSDQVQTNTEQPYAVEVNMDKIVETLSKIEAWVDFNSPPPVFKTNTAFVRFAVDIMNRCSYLLKLGVRASPNDQTVSKGYTKHRAIIVGHMVRLTKLYEGSLIHICSHQLELAHIFFRPIFETAIRMQYLMTSKPQKKSFRSFILASYKSEKETLQDLKAKAKERPLIQIEKRMRRKIISRLRKDGITQKELLNNKIWNINGKNFRDIMKILNMDSMYSYAYGSASHPVHGDWYDISLNHLKQDGRYYTPELLFTEPDPRLTCPLTSICLETILRYLKWNKSDSDGLITRITEKLHYLNRNLNDAHESTLGE